MVLSVVAVLWAGVVWLNRRRLAAVDGTRDRSEGTVIFVEPVRWLFVVWGFKSFVYGLRRAGCRHQVRLFRWSGTAGALLVLPDLMRRGRLLRKAERLARLVERIADQHPGCPLHLCGYSTGCYIAAEALRRIRPNLRVGRVILLAGTFSPTFPLADLSGRTSGVHTFHSPVDFVINGLGPLLFGCNDRRFSLAGGMVGLRHAPGFVTQYAWSGADVSLGYLGDHFSITTPRFIAARVAPLLTARGDYRPTGSE